MKNSNLLTLYVTSILLLTLNTFTYSQKEKSYNHEFSMSSSNDAFIIVGDDLDRFYSFGFGISLKSKDKKILGLENWFSSKVGFYYKIGLRIEGYTPTNKKVSVNEIVNNNIQFDRPFAGVTYGVFDFNYAFKRSNFKSGFVLGLIGENALAGDIQTWFHQNITNDPTYSHGWSYQIPDQIILNVNLVYTYDLLPHEKWYDIYAVAQAQIGNYRINASPLLGLRLGKFENLSKSISLDNGILGSHDNFELFFQSTISITLNGFDATAQGNLFNHNYTYAVIELNRLHSTFTNSIYYVHNNFSLGYEHYFTNGVTLKTSQHSYSKILLKYRF